MMRTIPNVPGGCSNMEQVTLKLEPWQELVFELIDGLVARGSMSEEEGTQMKLELISDE